MLHYFFSRKWSDLTATNNFTDCYRVYIKFSICTAFTPVSDHHVILNSNVNCFDKHNNFSSMSYVEWIRLKDETISACRWETWRTIYGIIITDMNQTGHVPFKQCYLLANHFVQTADGSAPSFTAFVSSIVYIPTHSMIRDASLSVWFRFHDRYLE